MTHLTYEQKSAAVYARETKRLARVNDESPGNWIASQVGAHKETLAKHLADYATGQEVLRSYTLQMFDSFSARAAAEHQADELEAQGYETYIDLWNHQTNPYVVYGLKPRKEQATTTQHEDRNIHMDSRMDSPYQIGRELLDAVGYDNVENDPDELAKSPEQIGQEVASYLTAQDIALIDYDGEQRDIADYVARYIEHDREIA